MLQSKATIDCYHFHSLHIKYFTYLKKVAILRCCLKKDYISQAVLLLTIDEWDSIENKYSFLSSIINVWPERSPTINEFWCKPKECFYSFPLQLEGVEVSLEYSCNLNCRWCQVKKELKNMDIKTKRKLTQSYFKTLEALKGHSLESIRLTENGEPLFFKNKFIKFVQSISESDFKVVSINTNGTLIDSEILNLIKVSPIKFFINVSLNAWDRESYTEIMGHDFFDQVMETIVLLSQLKNVNLQVSFVYDNDDYIPKIKNTIETLKMKNIQSIMWKAF